jgi:hypothetical protein
MKKVNIVVTNKRVVAIPYGKSNKAESWYYNKDITSAVVGEGKLQKGTIQNQIMPNSFGIVSGKSSQHFFINSKMTLKLFGTILGAAAKTMGAGMAKEFNESQAREARTDAQNAGRWTKEGMAFSNKAANNQAMAKVWEETAKNPTVHYKDDQDLVGKCKYIALLINQCIAATKG